MAGTTLTFAGNNLQTSNIITAEIDHHGIPFKDAVMYPLAHSNRSALPYINYPHKVITIRGKLSYSTLALLDAAIDTFKGYFNTEDGNLDIGYSGGTRRYIATAVSVNIDRPGGLAWANFEVIFHCIYPFGRATTATTFASEDNITNATDSWTHTVIGSAPYQLPVIAMAFDSVTDGDAFVRFTNNANGQGITVIGQTFEAADELVIDSYNRKVTLNSAEIDFIGAFMELSPGSTQINYADGFSARQFDIDIEYYPLYS